MRLLAGPCRTGAVPTLPKLRTPHNNQPSFVTSPCVAEADERAVPLRGLADPSRAESEEALQGPRRSQSCSCSVLGGGEGGAGKGRCVVYLVLSMLIKYSGGGMGRNGSDRID